MGSALFDLRTNTHTLMSFTFSIKGRNLPIADSKDSDPYFKFYVNGDKIYKSKTIKNTLNPDWDDFTLPRDKFGQFPRMVDVKVEVWDDDGIGKNDYMCSGYFKLINGIGLPRFHVDLKNEKTGDEQGKMEMSVSEN